MTNRSPAAGSDHGTRWRIPVCQPDLTGNEIAYVTDCISSSWISWRGEYVQQFESEFARFVGAPFAGTTCNGTAALHLALKALGVAGGDEVIVPALSYVAVANAAVYLGASPVFVDACFESWAMNPDDLEQKLTEKTRAVVVVHLYGVPGDLAKLSQICNAHGVSLIEDCSEAFGTTYDGRHVGAIGDVGTYSFYANKTITTGEGGMLTTSDEAVFTRCEHLRNVCTPRPDDYFHDGVGFNYRMTSVSAAIGLAQLERADGIIASKRKVTALYRDLLRGAPLFFQQQDRRAHPCYWLNGVVFTSADAMARVAGHLSEYGIQTKPFFRPLNTLPPFTRPNSSCPVAEDLWTRGLCLPSYPRLDEVDVKRVCNLLMEAL